MWDVNDKIYSYFLYFSESPLIHVVLGIKYFAKQLQHVASSLLYKLQEVLVWDTIHLLQVGILSHCRLLQIINWEKKHKITRCYICFICSPHFSSHSQSNSFYASVARFLSGEVLSCSGLSWTYIFFLMYIYIDKL